MIQRFYALAVVLAVLCLGAGVAEAKKVPIPCMSEKIVKVADLPRIDAFTTQGGQRIDLGYLYEGCFSGRWVGYVGSTDRYLTWKNDKLSEVVATAGLKKLPEAPGFLSGLVKAPGQFWVEWIYIVLAMAIVAYQAFVMLVKKALPAEASPVAGGAAAATVDESALRPGYEAALKAAVAARSTGATPQAAVPASITRTARLAPAPAPVRRPVRDVEPRVARPLPKVAVPAFGRRG